MAAPGFATLWEFAVRPSRQREFELHYGPDGTWVRLFRRAPGYLGSELLHDRVDPLRYVTIDRWARADDWRDFHNRFAADYERLDQECEGLTTREAPLGEYEPVPVGAA